MAHFALILLLLLNNQKELSMCNTVFALRGSSHETNSSDYTVKQQQ